MKTSLRLRKVVDESTLGRLQPGFDRAAGSSAPMSGEITAPRGCPSNLYLNDANWSRTTITGSEAGVESKRNIELAGQVAMLQRQIELIDRLCREGHLAIVG